MIINDRVYGRVEITEPVLLELIVAPSVQRLKRIGQFSLPNRENIFRDFTLYAHSVGVLLLLRRLGASLEEQVAGLLHDVSHTAFSHLIDWVLEDGDVSQENFQDQNHDRVINRSELPAILHHYGIDSTTIADHFRFGLLERDLPDLCADRVDYALREFNIWAKPEIVQPCLEALRVVDGQIVFADRPSTNSFARTFLQCYKEHWTEPSQLVRYHVFAQTLRKAMTRRLITIDDFYTDDYALVAKLQASGDTEIIAELSIIKRSVPFEIVENDPSVTLFSKFRAVDPLFLDNGKLKRLSEVDSDYAATFAEEREKGRRGLRVRVLPW